MNKGRNVNRYTLNSIEQYETLISAIPGGIVITAADSDFTILFANKGFYSMVGYKKDEFREQFHDIGNNALHYEDLTPTAESARRQLNRNGAFSVKARLTHKTKGYIWAHLNGKLSHSATGETVIFIVIVDVSEQQNTLKRLEKEQAFSELIATLSNEEFFDCDLATGSLRYSKSLANRLGTAETLPDYVKALGELGLPLIEYIADPQSQFLSALEGVFEDELHLTLPSGEQVWYRCRLHVIKDSGGAPVRLIGHLADITRHKSQLDELAMLAQRDALTGLYHKAATEHLIKETLHMRRANDQSCALMIIDVDNFKTVNDKLGHLYGDAVLTQLAEHLGSMFRCDDIVGRVGGDEFFVFLKNYGSLEMLSATAAKVCAIFHKTYSQGDTFVTISASIGISLYTQNNTEFDELYKQADAALYDAKAKGKNTYSFYTPELTPHYTSTRTAIDTSISQKNFKDNRIEYVFRLLYNSENPTFSIQAVLQLITESYGFSRGYIFETTPDGHFTSNTFEWCNEGIPSAMPDLQNIPIENIGSATTAFAETGMFILGSVSKLPAVERAILEPQGIRSMFQFGIKDMGRVVGFIGFDDCVLERTPTDIEIDEICTVCHVLATFLLRQRSNEREMLHHQALETVMDNMNSITYVIDPDNYTVLYENRSVLRLTGHSSLGLPCHLSYRGSEKPCADCPIPSLTHDKPRHVLEIHNEKYDMHVRTEVTRIDWLNGKSACLLCSMDILQCD